jgi:hypothetical protein
MTTFHKIFTIVAVFCCLLFSVTVFAEPRVHLVTVYDDEDKSLVESCKNDIDCVVKLLGDWKNKTVNRLTTSQGTNRLITTIHGLNVGNGDVVFFYYAGHGATNNGKHYLNYGNKIWRSDLRKALQAKNAKLTVLITDCCSNASRVKPLSPEEGVAGWDSVILLNTWKMLFNEHGLLDINSSTPNQSGGEAAFPDKENNNGIFTLAFEDILAGESVDSWKTLVNRCTKRTKELFKENYPDGASLPPPRQDKQKTQTVWVMSLPQQGGGGDVPAEDIGVVSEDPPGAGVQVVAVVQGTTATQLKDASGQIMTLEKGDVIDNINGMPISTLADYDNAIDSAPRNSEITISVRNNGKRVLLRGQLNRSNQAKFGVRVYGKRQ